MEKLGQLLAEDKWDLVVVDTPPSRNALDFLDAPKRLGSFMDSRLWRLLLAPGPRHRQAGDGRGRAWRCGRCRRCSAPKCSRTQRRFVQSLDSTFGGFREKADRTYELLKRRGTQFVVVSAAEPDALREASFFVDRLSQETMPLAGLILNRTHPTLCDAARRQGRGGRRPAGRPTDPDVAGRRGAADPRRPGADRQARGAAAVAVHRRQPARGDRRACRRCRSTCRIWRRCARSPIRSPATRTRPDGRAARRRCGACAGRRRTPPRKPPRGAA